MTSGVPQSVSPAFASAIRHLDETLRGIRAGRATQGLVENLAVDVYGSRQNLKALARIGIADPKTITVEPWDQGHVKIIEKAIASSPLGVNPVTAGRVIRISLPPLTADRRRELSKLVHQHVEEARIAIRSGREKHFHDLRASKAAGRTSEDAFERARKALQAETAVAVETAERLGKEKEAEILAI